MSNPINLSSGRCKKTAAAELFYGNSAILVVGGPFHKMKSEMTLES